MKNTKRFLSLIIALVMCLALVPAFAQTERVASGAMTEAQRAAAIEEVLSFSEKFYDMRSRYGTDYANKDASDAYATGRIVVKAKGSIDTLGALDEVTGHNDWHVLQYASSEEARAACKQFAAMKGVEYAVPDMIMHIDEVSDDGSFHSWGYNANNVNADSFNEWLLQYYGSEANIPTIVVAVIDTGCDSDHPFIMNRLLPGYDFSNNDSNPEDDHYHGTHVAGIVVDGTLSNVKIMPIKVLDSTGYGETVTVCLGIEYAYLHGCDVENMSLGGDCDGLEGVEHIMMRDAIEASANSGTVVCVAAGNETDNAMNHCPANIERAFTIASITSSHTLSYFSNYGSIVDIMAPGSDVSSANCGGGFATHSGTSMACPHAAAACAMVKSYQKDMPADTVVDILKSAAVDIGVTNAGSGMLCVTDLLKFDLVINAEGQNNHFTSTGTYPWQTEGNTAYSGNTGRNNTTSTLTCKIRLAAYQTISFDYKVSSQMGSDYFRFKVNGETMLESSGEYDWRTFSCTVPGGGDTVLTWEYTKDATGSSGSDMAFVRSVSINKTISSYANADGSSSEFVSTGSYPWVPDAEEGAAKSGNAGVHSSSSNMQVSSQLLSGMSLEFDYKVSSASGDNLIVRVNGNTVVNSGNTDGYVHYVYTAHSDGIYNIEFTYTKNASGSSGSDCAWVRGYNTLYTFASAANGSAYQLPFNNNGSYPWVVCGDYVMSSNTGVASSESAFTLTLAMEAGQTLSFRYRCSSETNYDFFYFNVNGSNRITRSGETNWEEYTFTASTSTTYTFKWSYNKDYSVDGNEDCAYVDDIVWSGGYVGLLGDVDMNGAVNANDALALMRFTLGLMEGSALDLTVADANGDGVVNVNDALTILRASLGLITL